MQASGDDDYSSSTSDRAKTCCQCSTMINVLSCEMKQEDVDHPPTAVAWTAHTLQQIVDMGSLKDGCTVLNSLSSTAMCNLLVILERNVRILPKETLEEFVNNIETLSFVSGDEWCCFLIKRLKRHIQGDGLGPPLVIFKEEVSSPLTTHEEGAAREDSVLGDVDTVEPPEGIPEEVVPSPADIKPPSLPLSTKEGTREHACPNTTSPFPPQIVHMGKRFHLMKI